MQVVLRKRRSLWSPFSVLTDLKNWSLIIRYIFICSNYCSYRTAQIFSQTTILCFNYCDLALIIPLFNCCRYNAAMLQYCCSYSKIINFWICYKWQVICSAIEGICRINWNLNLIKYYFPERWQKWWIYTDNYFSCSH